MKCIYIYNPKSGKGLAEKKRKYIVRELSKTYKNLDVIKTDHPRHAKELAEKSCGVYDYLFVAGGDGTLNEVVNGIAEKPKAPILGYIPLGTVNDFAHSARIPRKIKKAVKVICTGKPSYHEIFKVNNNYGVYICAMGVATETSYATKQKAKKALGKMAYFFHGLKKLFRTPTFPITIEFEGGCVKDSLALMLAVNSRYVASFPLNREFSFNDGYIDLLLVKEDKKIVSIPCLFTIARIFLFGLRGWIAKRTTHLKVNSFTLTTTDNNVINIDGEGVGSGKFEFQVIKNGMQIILPKKKKKRA